MLSNSNFKTYTYLPKFYDKNQINFDSYSNNKTDFKNLTFSCIRKVPNFKQDFIYYILGVFDIWQYDINYMK